MVETLCDSYSETNGAATQWLYHAADTDWIEVGQSLTGNGSNLSSAKFYLKKYGSPTGSIYAKLYAHSGTFGTNSVGTGAALATSDAFDIATLTTSFQLITFTFSGVNRVVLTNATKYIIAVRYYGGDGNNCLGANFDNTSPTHAGNLCYYRISSGWLADGGADSCFYVYTQPIPSAGGGILNWWMSFSEAWRKHDKLRTPKLIIPKLGYQI